MFSDTLLICTLCISIVNLCIICNQDKDTLYFVYVYTAIYDHLWIYGYFVDLWVTYNQGMGTLGVYQKERINLLNFKIYIGERLSTCGSGSMFIFHHRSQGSLRSSWTCCTLCIEKGQNLAHTTSTDRWAICDYLLMIVQL